jgi:hypothetical protein
MSQGATNTLQQQQLQQQLEQQQQQQQHTSVRIERIYQEVFYDC